MTWTRAGEALLGKKVLLRSLLQLHARDRVTFSGESICKFHCLRQIGGSETAIGIRRADYANTRDSGCETIGCKMI